MDQIKIGLFLKELRKEKNITQEELADQLNVARRTVSRWETGNNLPDLDILMELSDFYEVELRELLNGERTQKKMDKELEETVIKVAEYSNEEKKRSAKVVTIYSILGILAIVINMIMYLFEVESTFITDMVRGASYGLAICAMLFGVLYAKGQMEKMNAFKRRLLGRGKK